MLGLAPILASRDDPAWAEAFPDRFPSNPRYRFGWDDASLYRCKVITEYEP